jgi:hypothetical protein
MRVGAWLKYSGIQGMMASTPLVGRGEVDEEGTAAGKGKRKRHGSHDSRTALS